MSSHRKTDTVEREGVTIDVDYTYYSASRGAREKGSGVQLEPDEPATVEINEMGIQGIDVTALLVDFEEDIMEELLSKGDEEDGGY
jgi:hypothetical protein